MALTKKTGSNNFVNNHGRGQIIIILVTSMPFFKKAKAKKNRTGSYNLWKPEPHISCRNMMNS